MNYRAGKNAQRKPLGFEAMEDRRMLAAFTVNTEMDEVVVAANGAFTGSLRQMLENANQTIGPDTITFNLPAGEDKIELLHGQLPITDSVTITGPGWDELTIDASMTAGNTAAVGDGSRIFDVVGNGNLDFTISDLSLTGGDPGSITLGFDGGAIRASLSGSGAQGDTLTLENLRVHGNYANTGGGISLDVGTGAELAVNQLIVEDNVTESHGGGMYLDVSGGLAEVTESVFRNNTAGTEGDRTKSYWGGGLAFKGDAQSGQGVVSESLFSGNKVGFQEPDGIPDVYIGHGDGGGIAVIDGGLNAAESTDLILDGVAVVDNTAYRNGGGLYAGDESSHTNVEVYNSLFYSNEAMRGGGLWGADDSIHHSTIANNRAGFSGEFGVNTVAGGGVFAGTAGPGGSTSPLLSINNSIVFANAIAGKTFATDGGVNGDVPLNKNTALEYGSDYAVSYSGAIGNYDIDTTTVGNNDWIISTTIPGEYSIFGILDDALPDVGRGPTGTRDVIYDRSVSLQSSSSIQVSRLGIAHELIGRSDIHFLDCTMMPSLPLLPGSAAINFGDPQYDKATNTYPSRPGTTGSELITSDIRGGGFDRLVGRIDAGSFEFGATGTNPETPATATGDETLVYLNFTECGDTLFHRLTSSLKRDNLSAAQIDQVQDGIQAELEKIYGVFSGVSFTQEEPPTPHDTIHFLAGARPFVLGTSAGAFGDYRNQYTGDHVDVYVDQFGSTLQAHQNGGTSDADFIEDLISRLTGTAAHEHAHGAGLQHFDSYGDPDLGSFTVDTGVAPLGTTSTVDGQNRYLMSTGSTGAAFNDPEDDRRFSPLSLAKLEYAYGFHGPRKTTSDLDNLLITEDDVATSGVGQALSLDVLPITGFRAANVLGEISVPGQVDTYTFSAQAGDRLTVNVLSELFDFRGPRNTIGIDLTISDGSGNELAGSELFGYSFSEDIGGNVVAGEIGELSLLSGRVTPYGNFTDDGLVINLQFASAGTYQIEVSGDPGQTGEYELFATVARGLAFNAGDYNHDDLVDAEDYTDWRDSLGAYIAHGYGADGNGNGEVDTDDYTIWANNYGLQTGKALGDYNGNGVVDAGDYTVWRDSFGSLTDLAADGDGDGVIDIDDYFIWSDTFGSVVATPAFGLLSSIAGDFNADGMVDSSDFSLWEQGDLSADANDDGVVSLDDLAIWQQNYGGTTLATIAGDFNADGIVDTADYDLWAAGDLLADSDADGDVDQDDYNVWDAGFGTVHASLLPTIVNAGAGVFEIPGLAPVVVGLSLSAAGANPYDFGGLVGSGEQLRSVTTPSVDTVSVTFSEEVFVTQNALQLTNLDGTTPATVTSFDYDLATQTASWTFDSAFSDGRHLLTLDDSLYDLDRDALDGEFFGAWSLSDTNTATFPTGNGDAGGDFRFHFTVLDNDTDRDNIDGATDYTNWTSTEPGAIYVSKLTDEFDGDLSFGDVSLREAVDHANNTSGQTTVYVPEGTYSITIAGSESSSAHLIEKNDLNILGDVQVVGAGAGLTVIDMSGLSVNAHRRAFDVASTGVLDLHGVSIVNGVSYYSFKGTAIQAGSGSSVTVTDSALVNNFNLQEGTAIYSHGADLTVRRSVFTNNESVYKGGQAIYAKADGSTGGSLTIGESVFAINWDRTPTGPDDPNVLVGAGVALTNEGKNLYDDASGGFFDTTPGMGDHLGTPDYVVTSVADTFDHTDNDYSLSLREAIDLANQSGSASEAWLPAWSYTLTRDRQAHGGGSATDTDVAFGDLDISDNLTIRGIADRTRVQWKAGVVDEVFDLLGDYNNDGQADYNNVSSADYSVWSDSNGSGSGTSADWEVFAADGDDDGDVDQDDYNLWNNHFGNTLNLFDVS